MTFFLNVAFSESLFCRQWLACVCQALLLFRYHQLPLISSLISSVSSMNWSLIAQVLITTSRRCMSCYAIQSKTPMVPCLLHLLNYNQNRWGCWIRVVPFVQTFFYFTKTSLCTCCLQILLSHTRSMLDTSVWFNSNLGLQRAGTTELGRESTSSTESRDHLSSQFPDAGLLQLAARMQ